MRTLQKRNKERAKELDRLVCFMREVSCLSEEKGEVIMGMYTELNLGVEIENDLNIIHDLKIMLREIDREIISNHALFKTPGWDYMLLCDSYYFDGQTDSKLFKDDLDPNNPRYYLNVRCNLKNYDNEIKLFLDWLRPYILTEGFLGYMRYEESYAPTLIYKKDNKIIYNEVIFNDMG